MDPNYQEQETGGKKTLWIVAGVVIVIMIIGIVYGATQKTLKKQSADVGGLNSSLNDSGFNADGTPIVAADMVTTPVTVTALDVVNLKTFPYKVQARVKADLADACSTGSATVTQSGKIFTVIVTAMKPKDSVCAAVITPYETVVDLPVAGLAAGTYTVKMGTFTKTFTLDQDNAVQFTSEK